MIQVNDTMSAISPMLQQHIDSDYHINVAHISYDIMGEDGEYHNVGYSSIANAIHDPEPDPLLEIIQLILD